MTNKFSLPRGTSDILPDQISRWQIIEQTARKILEIYGYKELRTPLFEETGLFSRSLGQTSDVVQKQMLNLEKDGLTLRPEGTASIIRSYIENNIDKKQNLAKFYNIGPMFRGERPQKGRLRQFNQIGVEAIGITEPFLDAEVIALCCKLLRSFGLDDFNLKINSLGTPDDKKSLSDILRKKLKQNLSQLCDDCQKRFERNVFRVLDCKNKSCKKIVSGIDVAQSHLSPKSLEYFSKVKEALKMLDIAFEVWPSLVRGLDYYTHTVFEVSCDTLGSQDALGAGGRYDNLSSDLGGPNVGSVGFALGIERILLAKPENPEKKSSIDVFLLAMGQEAYKKSFLLLNEIRNAGISAEMSYQEASVKSQMRLADKLGVKYVVLIGEDELSKGKGTVKDMGSGTQEEVSFDDIQPTIKRKLL